MWDKQLAAAIEAGEYAKREILDIYKTDFSVEYKSDKTPVTLADKKSDKIIREYLKKKFPEYCFLSEENVDDKKRLDNDFVWIIDPLDGTCNFVKKNDGFAINIALAYKHKVVVGVVIVPMQNEIYYASLHGGAFLSSKGSVREIHVSRRVKNLRLLKSRSFHGKNEEAMIAKYGDRIKSQEFVGASIKACMIAKGEAELSFILNGSTKEWDTAASQLIVKEAGGIFIEPHGTWLKYNRNETNNKNGYIIANRRKNIIY